MDYVHLLQLSNSGGSEAARSCHYLGGSKMADNERASKP